MIHVVNYASNQFLESQSIQNASWAAHHDDATLTLCSYRQEDVLPILQSLKLANEDAIRAVLARPRGDGLWAWKAILTHHVYTSIARTGDIVFYMDTGACPVQPFDRLWEHIRSHGQCFVRVAAVESVSAVQDYLDSLPGFVGKRALVRDMDFSSRLWTKPFPALPANESGFPSAVLDRLVAARVPLAESSAQLMAMGQVCGGFQGYLKRRQTHPVLVDMLASTSLAYFDDDPEAAADQSYIEHRHDQAILSLIVNAECVRSPEFATCIVDDLKEVCLHRTSLLECPCGPAQPIVEDVSAS